MNTPIEEMSDRELLMELVENKRKEQTYRVVRLCLMLLLIGAVVASGYVYIRPALQSAQEISASLKEVTTFLNANQDVVTTIESIANDIDMNKINAIADTMKELEPSIQAIGKWLGQ